MNVCVLKPEWAHPSFTVLNRHRGSVASRPDEKVWVSVLVVPGLVSAVGVWLMEVRGRCQVLIELRSKRRQGERGAIRQDRELSVPCSPDRKLPVFYRLSLLPLSALTSPRPAGLVTFTLKKNGTGPAGIKTHRHKHPLLEQNLNLIQKQYGHCSGMHR